MPNRYIREDAIESEAVNSLSWQGEVFYRRLLNRVDDFGRIATSLLLAKIFPLQLDRVTQQDISDLLTECQSAGLLAVYQVDGREFLQVNKWEVGRAKKSKCPDPPPNICEQLQTFAYMSQTNVRGSPTNVAARARTDSDSDSDSDSATDQAPSRPGCKNLRMDEVVAWIDLQNGTIPDPVRAKSLAAELIDEMDAKKWRIDGQPVQNPMGLLINRLKKDNAYTPS